MKIALLSFALPCAAMAAVKPAAPPCGSTPAPGLPATWKVGAKWQFAIQDPVSIPGDCNTKLVPDADVWDIDLWHAYKNTSIAKGLHDRGKTVICYFNFGAVQPQDCDFETWLDMKLWTGPWFGDVNPGNGNKYCERFEDLKNKTVLKLIERRLNLAVEAGCDGVDPDNIDVPGLDEDEIFNVLKDMATYAHSKTTKLGNPLMIGQKNYPNLSKRLVKFMDFAVLESCLITSDDQKPFCNQFNNYLSQSPPKPVIDIEYPASLYDKSDETSGCKLSGVSADDRNLLCAKGGKDKTPKGMSEILKLNYDDFGLNGCTQYCQDPAAVVTKVNDKSNATCSYTFPKCSSNKELKDNCCCGGCKKKFSLV